MRGDGLSGEGSVRKRGESAFGFSGGEGKAGILLEKKGKRRGGE